MAQLTKLEMENLNKANDKIISQGKSKIVKKEKEIAEVQEALKNEETKKALNDYIFGKAKKSPLEDIRKKYK